MRPPPHVPQQGTPAQARKQYDKDRGSREERGYDQHWRLLRIAHLMSEPLCRDCQAIGRITAARDVHHIIKIRDDPDRRLDPTNLASLCTPCHSARTARGE